MLLLIYGRLDKQASRVGKPISSSVRCQAFYSSLRKVHEHSIANFLSILSSALVVRVVQRATHKNMIINSMWDVLSLPDPFNQEKNWYIILNQYIF